MRTLNKTALLFASALHVLSCSLFGAPTTGLRDEADPSSEFMISFWRTSDGLPVNEIHDIKETSDGYLWMGTHRGLVRFDGQRFETFFDTPTGLRYGTRAGPLEVDARGQLWFASDQVGITRRDTNGFSEALTNGTVLKARVTSLCSDGTNEMLWVDANGRLGKFSIENPTQSERIQDGKVSAGARWMLDFRNQLWLANLRNLKIFKKGKGREVSVPGNATMIAAPRRSGGLWIARDAKLRWATSDGETREVATFPWKGQSRVTCMTEDSRKRLWIGTVGQGIFCYSSGEFKQVVTTASSILSLFVDSQGNLWAGTRGSGLIRVRQRQFFMHNLNTGLENEFVRSLSQDKNGRVWMMTAEGGLGWWQDGSWHEVDSSKGWPGYDSMCVLPAKLGGVWISTAHRGLFRWLDGKLTKSNLGTNAPREAFMDLLEDKSGQLWMVTDNSGIFCFKENKLTRYSASEGLPSDYIRQIIEDDNGTLWAGDWEGAIAKLHDERWEIVRQPSGHKDAVRSMVAVDGALWIGTSAGGLLRFKDGQTSRFSIEEGLPDACVQQLLVDGDSLWGGTPHKLFRTSLKQLNAVMAGREKKIDAITYGRNDGLPDVSFANWCDPRCWRTKEGELWFATANGAIHFQPANLQETKPPQVFFEQTLLNGKPITTSSLQALRPGPSRLEFRFTAPCLTASERVRFRYQLTGVDPGWVETETSRSATYASVPAGKHEFRVVASSPEGVWNSVPVTMSLSVRPFFWQTQWFLASVVAAIAGSGVWIARRATMRRLNRRLERLRQQSAMDRERARIAQDIHDELGANLTSIGLLADMGTRHKMDSFMVARELRQISETARESVTAMDAIVWALNPSNDSLDHFANYISQFTREFFSPTELRTRLNLPTDLPTHPMSTETRHELLLIVKESFNNIIRHAEASEVNVELACDNGRLRLVIADNGKGLTLRADNENHNGLSNLRARMERIGGTFEIVSPNGHGTKLEFILPLSCLRPN